MGHRHMVNGVEEIACFERDSEPRPASWRGTILSLAVVGTLAASMIVSLTERLKMWFTIYGAAFGGWLLSIAVRTVWQVAFELVLGMRTRRYQAAYDALSK